MGPAAGWAAERETAVVPAQAGSGVQEEGEVQGVAGPKWRVCEVVGKVPHPRGTVRNGDGRVPLR